MRRRETASEASGRGAEVAAFEAGIKLGAIYHQFIGTPVTPASARGLERAMEGALRAMPFCTKARARIDRRKLRRGLNRFGYTELRGQMLDVEVEVCAPQGRARARISERNGYPWMALLDAESSHGNPPFFRAPASGREGKMGRARRRMRERARRG